MKATDAVKPDSGQGEQRRRGKFAPRDPSCRAIGLVKARSAPAGSRFKGYETYLVQELVLSVRHSLPA